MKIFNEKIILRMRIFMGGKKMFYMIFNKFIMIKKDIYINILFHKLKKQHIQKLAMIYKNKRLRNYNNIVYLISKIINILFFTKNKMEMKLIEKKS